MSDWDDDTLRKWLKAERGDAPDEADRLFFAVASAHLRRLDAPMALADRVLSALPARPFVLAGPVFDLAASWWARLTAVAAVVILGVGMALVSPRQLIELGTGGMSMAVRAIGGIGVALSAAHGIWKASIDLMATLGLAAGHVAATGMMPMVIVANLAVATAAFAGLKRLLTPPEECV
jgi:hypothetical protein